LSSNLALWQNPTLKIIRRINEYTYLEIC
jgi:hypothetical protein